MRNKIIGSILYNTPGERSYPQEPIFSEQYIRNYLLSIDSCFDFLRSNEHLNIAYLPAQWIAMDNWLLFKPNDYYKHLNTIGSRILNDFNPFTVNRLNIEIQNISESLETESLELISFFIVDSDFPIRVSGALDKVVNFSHRDYGFSFAPNCHEVKIHYEKY